ncbi:MAG: flippase-like domain-containing protein [Phycisphaerae bacterium]|nr:flippase-like domain-containing protein [Phycisphaerae bacterium]
MQADTISERKKKILNILRISVALLALIVIIFICYRQRDDFKTLFASLPPKIFIAGILLFVLANIIISLRWYLLLGSQNIKVPFKAAMKVHFLGLFYNNIMVSSVGGDMLRVWYIAKYTTKRLEAGLSVVVDRLLGLFSLILMALTFYFLFPVDLPAGKAKAGLWARISPYSMQISMVLGFIALAIAVILIYKPTRTVILNALLKILSHRQRVAKAIALYCTKPLTLAMCTILTFFAQSLPIIGFWMMGKAMDIPIPAKYYFVFFPISWVLGALPVSIGGIGVLEGGLAGLFAVLPGVTFNQGLALALCQRFVFILGSMPGVCIHLTGAHLPSDKEEIFIDSDLD